MVQGSFWHWTKFGGLDDYLELQASNDGGGSWTTVIRVDQATTPNWDEATFRLTPWMVGFTSQMRFRFVAEDGDPESPVEVLVDDFVAEELSGTSTAIDGDDVSAAAPLRLQLGNPTPNPFNPSTAIPYTLSERAGVSLAIFDVGGRLLTTLVDGVHEAGEHVARWDGTALGGVPAASGIYYARLTVGSWTSTRSMVLLK